MLQKNQFRRRLPGIRPNRARQWNSFIQSMGPFQIYHFGVNSELLHVKRSDVSQILTEEDQLVSVATKRNSPITLPLFQIHSNFVLLVFDLQMAESTASQGAVVVSILSPSPHCAPAYSCHEFSGFYGFLLLFRGKSRELYCRNVRIW